MYIKETTSEVVSIETRLAIIELVKILYKLDVINDTQALNIATQFRAIFV